MIKHFTDNDLDGLGCGILAKIAYGDNVSITYSGTHEIDQKVSEFLNNSINKSSKIFITDLSLKGKAEKLAVESFKNGWKIELIDHHQTALHFNNYEWGFVKANYEDGKKTSATSLFYEYLVSKNLLKEKEIISEFVELVRQYDTWEWEKNENKTAKRLNDLLYLTSVSTFEEVMVERLTNHDSFFFTDSENTLLDAEEEKIKRYFLLKNKQLVQKEIDGHIVGIVFAENYQSEVGNLLAKENAYLDLIALINVGSKKVSLRTIHEDVNVSLLAKNYGGGGHPKASGFTLDDDTFNEFVAGAFSASPRLYEPENNKFNTKNGSYISMYKTASNKLAFIIKNEDGFFIKQQEKILDESFENFFDAERKLKRLDSFTLTFDEDFINLFSAKYELKAQHLRSQFKKEMPKIIENELKTKTLH